jgi:hypothetical protein
MVLVIDRRVMSVVKGLTRSHEAMHLLLKGWI